jgi:hypothetical protein
MCYNKGKYLYFRSSAAFDMFFIVHKTLNVGDIDVASIYFRKVRERKDNNVLK